MTNGHNIVTVRFTDRAGNTTTTNLNLTLNYSQATNPPVLNLIWPQNGMLLGGNSFYLRGTISDETASVIGQIMDSSNNTSTVTGIIERNGKFWLENIPLSPGTNVLTIIANDAAGNITTTNITVTQSTAAFTINSTPTGNGLYAPSGFVSGEIGASNYTVSVNGVAASVGGQTSDGNYSWQASNVPIYGQGTATFDAAAAESAGDQPVNVSAEVDKGPFMAVTGYNESKSVNYMEPEGGDSYTTCNENYMATYDSDQIPQNYQGTYNQYNIDTWSGGSSWSDNFYSWSPDGAIEQINRSNGYSSTNALGSGPPVPDTDLLALSPTVPLVQHYYASASYAADLGGGYSVNVTCTAGTQVTFYTGGKGQIGEQSLFCLNAQPTEYSDSIVQPNPDAPWVGAPNAPTGGQLVGQNLDTNGNVWTWLPNGSQLGAIVTVSANHYSGNAQIVNESNPGHSTVCTAAGNPDNTRTTIGIGELVTFTNCPPEATLFASGNGIIGRTLGGPLNSWTFTASMSPGTATVTFSNVDNSIQPVTFQIIAPDSIIVLSHVDDPPGIQNPNGTIMGAQTDYVDQFGPTTVSFANVNFRENPSPLNVTVNWPGKTNAIESFTLQSSYGVGCNNILPPDNIGPPLVSTNYIFNGTSSVNFSYSVSWTNQYQNALGGWSDACPMNATFQYGSDKTCTITYEGTPGGTQGPY